MLVTCTGMLVVDITASGQLEAAAPGEATSALSGERFSAGGHAANVSIDLLKLGLAKGEVSCSGAVGQDDLGDFIIKELEKNGVVTHVEKVEKTPTGSATTISAEGEARKFHFDIGANTLLEPLKVRDLLRRERPCVFYIGATGSLGLFDEQLPRILREVKEELDCVTVVDPIQPQGHGWEFLARASEWIDVLHCNGTEAESMTGKHKSTEALNAIANRGVKLPIITLGNEGLVAKHAYDRVAMPAFKVPVVDPMGAGAAFSAGVVFYLTRKADKLGKIDVAALTRKELLDLLLEGQAAGAACVTDVGTTKAVTRENVDRILQEQKGAIMDQMRIGFSTF
ncbi:MAG: carbohydrate kinase family protein [Promethearchaeati archaeon SRVP18_Atabeyarchaeia-1]